MIKVCWSSLTAILLCSASPFAQCSQELAIKPISDTFDRVSVIQVDFSRFDISVTATSRVNGFSSQAPTLESFASIAARNQRTPINFAALSGGFSSYDPMEPSGLLVENGRILSPPARKTQSLSGILCVDRRGMAKILYVEEYMDRERDCQWALQAGPLVVEPGREAINRSTREKSLFRRIVACETEDPELFEFYLFERADLRDVEDALRRRCKIALNLTGDVQGGALVSSERGVRSSFGSSKSPLASIIFVKPREQRNPFQSR
jgi:uncharacterized protein YigE (DUF2233 family)